MSSAIRASNSGLTWEQAKEFVSNPLTQLPTEFQLPVWGFWAFFSDILTGQLGLASRINFWIANCDLTLPKLTRAFDAMRKPPLVTEYKFASDVLAGIMATVEEQERQDSEEERKRRDKEAIKANVAGERVASNLAEQFAMPRRCQ